MASSSSCVSITDTIVPWVRPSTMRGAPIAGPDGLSSVHAGAFARARRTHRSRRSRLGRRTGAVRARLVPVARSAARSTPTPRPSSRTPSRLAPLVRAARFMRARGASPVLRSLLTLEALTFEATGGIVAAPTTSLPESLGGTRNWDYRYLLGARRDADARGVAHRRLPRRSSALARVAAARAWPATRDSCRSCTASAANADSPSSSSTGCPATRVPRPVRTGNGAHAQLQLDVYGELLDVLWQATRAGTPPSRDTWSLAQLLLDVLEERWREPDEGIWEVRGPRRHFTHSKVMCWVAFDRAHRDGRARGLRRAGRSLAELRDEIHAEVLPSGYNEQLGAFMQSSTTTRSTPSLLMIPLVGFLPGDDPRGRFDVDAIRRDLTDDGFVLRYDPTHATSTASASRKACSCRAASGWSRRSRWPDATRRGARAVRAAARPRERSRPARRGVRPARRNGSSATSRRHSRTSRSSPPRTRSRRVARPAAPPAYVVSRIG